MKVIGGLLLLILMLIPQFEPDNSGDKDLVLVTFKCESCKIKNKFEVSGPTEFVMERVDFPFSKKMKPGKYEMTYWQNRVQQIHLPFSVHKESENLVIVKE
ncbi:hypothetical protein [Flagellimonas algicola]|uniref:Uncharacterized protein n=1 Tax=Flagellimonas algicola TaxID=2583815 RepID=A0ABY2WIR6_9FLAO|nr:hypothetical protein [Allomuricauda algicola]TMU54743.1 hypothetical protein FGG15_11115 [Allomuricauda algicola]